uniref:Uncharacterized protein n=1 Tax=Arundo donax TaxID=35708 RepID=A0A0A8XY87_ARUDO
MDTALGFLQGLRTDPRKYGQSNEPEPERYYT